jgi:hypothetical protein
MADWREVFGPVGEKPNPRTISEKYQKIRASTPDNDRFALNALFTKAIKNIKADMKAKTAGVPKPVRKALPIKETGYQHEVDGKKYQLLVDTRLPLLQSFYVVKSAGTKTKVKPSDLPERIFTTLIADYSPEGKRYNPKTKRFVTIGGPANKSLTANLERGSGHSLLSPEKKHLKKDELKLKIVTGGTKEFATNARFKEWLAGLHEELKADKLGGVRNLNVKITKTGDKFKLSARRFLIDDVDTLDIAVSKGKFFFHEVVKSKANLNSFANKVQREFLA